MSYFVSSVKTITAELVRDAEGYGICVVSDRDSGIAPGRHHASHDFTQVSELDQEVLAWSVKKLVTEYGKDSPREETLQTARDALEAMNSNDPTTKSLRSSLETFDQYYARLKAIETKVKSLNLP